MLVEHDDLRHADRIVHRAAEDAVFADALVHARFEEVRMVELIGRQLEPDLVVLVPEVEEPLRLLRVLDDRRERLRELRGLRGGRRRGGGCRGVRVSGARRAVGGRVGVLRFIGGGGGGGCGDRGGVRGPAVVGGLKARATGHHERGERAKRQRRAGRAKMQHERDVSWIGQGGLPDRRKGDVPKTGHAGESSPRNECGSAAVMSTST